MNPAKHDAPSETNRKAFFNKVASSWDEQFCNADLENFLKYLVPKFDLATGERILDLGTGTGVLVPHLVRAVGPSGLIVAVDFAEKMLEVCKRKYSGLPNVKVELQNAEELDFPPEHFDAIICFGLFPHIENKQKALFKMNHILKQKGKLIIAHALSSNEIKEHHRKASTAVAQDALPEEKEMRRLLKRAGFATSHIKDEPGLHLCITTKTLQY